MTNIIKVIFSICALSALSIQANGQSCGKHKISLFSSYTFDNANNSTIIFPDSTNLWQIGIPQKPVFNSSVCNTNVMCTDLNNSYPSDTVSYFIIPYHNQLKECMDISGMYYSSSDLTDSVNIYLSIDTGANWYNINTSYTHFFCPNGGSYFDGDFFGESQGWNWFYAELPILYFCNNHGLFNVPDTLLFKFEFKSDSISSNKDGVMFDDITFSEMAICGTNGKCHAKKSLSSYPNPAGSFITWKLPNEETDGICHISFYSSDGKLVFQTEVESKNRTISLNKLNLKAGNYFYKITTSTKTIYRGRILITK